MSHTRKILTALCAVAAVGALVATYDFVARMLHIPLFCPFAGNGCDIVQDSPYAVVLGVPLSFLGILGFGAYTLLGYIGLRVGERARWYLYALALLNALELASMAYFSYLELAVIHAVCSICVFAAALQVALAFLIAFAMRSKQPGGTDQVPATSDVQVPR